MQSHTMIITKGEGIRGNRRNPRQEEQGKIEQQAPTASMEVYYLQGPSNSVIQRRTSTEVKITSDNLRSSKKRDRGAEQRNGKGHADSTERAARKQCGIRNNDQASADG